VSIVFTVVLLLLIAALARAAWRLWLAYSSRHWPRTTGRVIRSSYANAPDPADLTSHRLSVQYEYFVGGMRYTGDTLTIGAARYLPHDSAKEIALRYAPGTIVTLRYHPRRPRLAVVNAGQVGFAVLNLVIMFFVIAGAIVVGYHLRE
jgi:hypothetical protein